MPQPGQPGAPPPPPPRFKRPALKRDEELDEDARRALRKLQDGAKKHNALHDTLVNDLVSVTTPVRPTCSTLADKCNADSVGRA